MVYYTYKFFEVFIMGESFFSQSMLSKIVLDGRKQNSWSQQELADKTGINRAMISRIEQGDYIPSIPQLESLSQALEFDLASLFVSNSEPTSIAKVAKTNIAVAGTGYVGLSNAVLLAQHHHVVAVDVIPEKVELINARKAPIQDDYIEQYLAEKELDLVATTLQKKYGPDIQLPAYEDILSKEKPEEYADIKSKAEKSS